MNRLRMGVVGVGALGRHHARILSELDGVQLVAIAEPHEERGQDAAKKHHCEWVADYRDLIGRVDAVSVVVPTVGHRTVAGAFLEAGVAVLVEKPLASTLSEATELCELADRRGVVFQVGHVERFNPAWQAALPACKNPRYIRAERVSPFTFRSTDIGVVLDLMIHDLDLSLSLVDSPIDQVDAFGVGVMGGHEDAAQARIVFQNGCIADLSASRINPTAGRSFQVWSDAGCTLIDLHQRTVVRYAPSDALKFGPSPLELARQPGADMEQLKKDVFGRFIQQDEIPVFPGDALTAELASFAEAVRCESRPLVTGRDAWNAMHAADRVLASIAQRSVAGNASERRVKAA